MQQSERVKIVLPKSWFDLLVESLLETRRGLSTMVKVEEDAWKRDLEANEILLKHISKYARYYKSNDIDMVDVQVFPREASELVWQLLLCCGVYVEPPEEGRYYEMCKAEHEEYMRKKNLLPQGAARELFNLLSVGYDLLVKNKNGKCYHVDHGRSGDLVKRDKKWEDPEYGFDENVFCAAEYNYSKIVSWSDETPLDVADYLRREGWMKEDAGENVFIPQE